MPLDATSQIVTLSPLTAALAEFPIEPVTAQALDAHKRAQLRRFRPSFWYQHRFPLAGALLASILCLGAAAGMTDGLMTETRWLPLYVTTAWTVLVTVAIAGGAFRLAAGPQWEERWLPVGWLRRTGVPEPIADLAEALHRAVPGSALILGELVQQAEVLDPYLLIEYEGEQVCLGIWDESGTVVRAG
jgi:hypothetical protein